MSWENSRTTILEHNAPRYHKTLNRFITLMSEYSPARINYNTQYCEHDDHPEVLFLQFVPLGGSEPFARVLLYSDDTPLKIIVWDEEDTAYEIKGSNDANVLAKFAVYAASEGERLKRDKSDD